MIQVVRKIDLENLNKIKIPKAFHDYVERYFLEMTKRFAVDDLSGIGTVFVIESTEDIEKYGLETFLLKHPPCRVVGLTLHENEEPIFITHILVKETGSAAVNIFAQEEHLKDTLGKYYNSFIDLYEKNNFDLTKMMLHQYIDDIVINNHSIQVTYKVTFSVAIDGEEVEIPYQHIVKEARKKLQKVSLPCVETLPKTKGA